MSISPRWGTRTGHGVMYACECRQKGHFFFSFLTVWSVESTNAVHTKIRSESKSQHQENENEHFAALSTDKSRVTHQRHEMGSEGRPNQCKYWNLRPVVMPECSLIATRNSHAKHNQSVGRIPEHWQERVAHQRHEMSSERSQKSYKYWNLHAAVMSDYTLIATRNSHAKTQEISGSHTSRRWAPTKHSCISKTWNG